MLFSPSEEGNTMFFNLGSYSMGFFFPLSRVLMDFDKNKNMLFIRYLESFDIYEKSKKNGKVKEVSLKVLDSEKSEEFFKVFSLIFKVRKSLNKKGVVWVNSGASIEKQP